MEPNKDLTHPVIPLPDDIGRAQESSGGTTKSNIGTGEAPRIKPGPNGEIMISKGGKSETTVSLLVGGVGCLLIGMLVGSGFATLIGIASLLGSLFYSSEKKVPRIFLDDEGIHDYSNRIVIKWDEFRGASLDVTINGSSTSTAKLILTRMDGTKLRTIEIDVRDLDKSPQDILSIIRKRGIEHSIQLEQASPTAKKRVGPVKDIRADAIIQGIIFSLLGFAMVFFGYFGESYIAIILGALIALGGVSELSTYNKVQLRLLDDGLHDLRKKEVILWSEIKGVQLFQIDSQGISQSRTLRLSVYRDGSLEEISVDVKGLDHSPESIAGYVEQWIN